MARLVRVYLRAPLFTNRSRPHVPVGTCVLLGKADDPEKGLVQIAAEVYQDADGERMKGAARTLLLPLAKIDNIDLLSEDEFKSLISDDG